MNNSLSITPDAAGKDLLLFRLHGGTSWAGRRLGYFGSYDSAPMTASMRFFIVFASNGLMM